MATRSGSNSDERLVVVPTQTLLVAGLRPGFDPDVEPILTATFSPGAAQLLPRSLAECDERFKQIICYVVLLYGCRIYHYRRSARVGESRLAGLRSLGFGGHLNASDIHQVEGPSSLDRAIRRELAEEVVIDADPDIQIVGVINDDSNAVGRVHLGLVIHARLKSAHVELRENTLADGRFDLLPDLLARQEDFESWSRLCLPTLAEMQRPPRS